MAVFAANAAGTSNSSRNNCSLLYYGYLSEGRVIEKYLRKLGSKTYLTLTPTPTSLLSLLKSPRSATDTGHKITTQTLLKSTELLINKL